jgi:DNA-binding response OmpR family regulator
MDKIKVLLIEDEEILAMVIKETLEGRGFEMETAANGVEGWSKFNAYKPDICVLDIMMPRRDGLSLLSDIRLVNPDIPVIILSAKTQTDDVLKGLELGADDYMKKPFSMEELILRIKNVLRRTRVNQAPNTTEAPAANFAIGKYTFSPTRLELVRAETVINLSQREADLLYLLAGTPNKTLDKRTALVKIWGEDNFFNSRTMDVYITRLRKYLSLEPSIKIVNIRGKGYKLIDT